MFEDELAALPPQPPRTALLPGMRLGAALPGRALLLVLVFLALFASMPLTIIRSDPMMRLQFGPSREVEAHILSVSDSTCGGSRARRVVYEFSSADGRHYRGSAQLCEQSPYYSVGLGESIPVRYLGSDPAVNAVRGASNNAAPPLIPFVLFPLFFLLILSPMYVPQFREVMRARRLFRNGLLATAQVVFVRKRNTMSWPGWPGSGTADVFLSFQLPSGQRREGIAWCANEWLLNQCARGAAVHIAFMPDRPERVALLEAFLR
jgi:Protein of unknown function (DUF3592)